MTQTEEEIGEKYEKDKSFEIEQMSNLTFQIKKYLKTLKKKL